MITKRVRTWVRPALVFAILLSMLVACAKEEPSENDDSGNEIARIEHGSLVTSVTATGSVQVGAEVTLSLGLGGEIEEILVEEGERVEAGQLLLRLNDAELYAGVQQAEASLAAAEAQLAQLQADPRPEESAAAQANLDAAQAALDAAVAERQRLGAGITEAEIAAAEAQVASALSQQRIAQNVHDDTIKCYKVALPGGGTREVCPALGRIEEEARYNLHAANEALASAQAQLDALLAGEAYQLRAAYANENRSLAQRDAAQAQFDLLLAGATEEQLAAARAIVNQAEATLTQAKLRLGQTTLTAPCDGTVTYVGGDPGEFIAPQVPVIILVDTSRFLVRVDVDEADIGRVTEGQEVEITLDAFRDEVLKGTVAFIAPTAVLEGGIIAYRVTIEIEPSQVQLRGGMTANATFFTSQRDQVLLVPNRAITVNPETGDTFVERVTGDQMSPVQVETGARNDTYTEIVAGLEEGDEVLIRDATYGDELRELIYMPGQD